MEKIESLTAILNEMFPGISLPEIFFQLDMPMEAVQKRQLTFELIHQKALTYAQQFCPEFTQQLEALKSQQSAVSE
jgi:hypothetical protein